MGLVGGGSGGGGVGWFFVSDDYCYFWNVGMSIVCLGEYLLWYVVDGVFSVGVIVYVVDVVDCWI